MLMHVSLGQSTEVQSPFVHIYFSVTQNKKAPQEHTANTWIGTSAIATTPSE